MNARRRAGILCFMLLSAFAFRSSPVEAQTPLAEGACIIASYPHDRTAFTQGLLVDGETLYESTGLYGKSDVRVVDLSTGAVEQERDLPADIFGEGLARVGERLVQLSWQEQTGYVYELATLAPAGTFSYTHEGWGITYDGRHLLVSDGSSTIRRLDPTSFAEVGRFEVRDGAVPVQRLNELEMVRGQLWANVWQTDRIARIDPATGLVLGWLDLQGLLPPAERAGADVLNGIAYDAARDRLFVTGKLWPTLFELRVDAATAPATPIGPCPAETEPTPTPAPEPLPCFLPLLFSVLRSAARLVVDGQFDVAVS